MVGRIMNEIWKSIHGFQGLYEVNNFGQVRRIHKDHRAKSQYHILKPCKKNNGYIQVTLSKHCKLKYVHIHTLVLEAFDCLRPKNKECNHKDGNKTNNQLENLEWVTKSENQKHKFAMYPKACIKGSESPMAKLNDENVVIIKSRIRTGESCCRIAKDYNVSDACIYHIKNGRHWRHIL